MESKRADLAKQLGIELFPHRVQRVRKRNITRRNAINHIHTSAAEDDCPKKKEGLLKEERADWKSW
eukprot:CAMPEP_0203662080 /NCGR_PEP_ID=MMETSP0090-20130426/173_1 /ASSEMBLY_ACC=CAM_ASM_001088 /TAXON_ID=426623 /ORGANISM="Chaetoceros affinis, Strain CCMP159" /LENGTH=65 /DNA_ID=CAMNT_0050524823 /DNA_START=46 /DNA_END=240 /DNA_ORIENTATION=+